MTKEKRACPSAGTPGQAAEMGTTCRESTFSTFQSITSPPVRQIRIADLLPTGQENAVPLRHIKQMVDLPGREIRRQIQMEREQHVPIVSDLHGYYLAANVREKERFVRGMKRRAAEIVKVAEAVEEASVGD